MVLILELKTTQTAAIKILTDTLNSLLSDVNFVFRPMYYEEDDFILIRSIANPESGFALLEIQFKRL